MTMKVRSTPLEKWKQIILPKPTKMKDYYISNCGRVKSVDKFTGDESLRKIVFTNRVATVSIRFMGSGSTAIFIGRKVAELFVKNPKKHQHLIHLDNDQKNNHYKNLKWVNQKQLTAHQIKYGVYDLTNRKLGSHVKMTESKVALLKKRLQKGKTKRKVLAKTFGITTTQLKRIETGENWGHVKAAE